MSDGHIIYDFEIMDETGASILREKEELTEKCIPMLTELGSEFKPYNSSFMEKAAEIVSGIADVQTNNMSIWLANYGETIINASELMKQQDDTNADFTMTINEAG